MAKQVKDLSLSRLRSEERRTKHVGFLVSPTEHATLRVLAKKAGLTVYAYLMMPVQAKLQELQALPKQRLNGRIQSKMDALVRAQEELTVAQKEFDLKKHDVFEVLTSLSDGLDKNSVQAKKRPYLMGVKRRGV